MSKFKAGDKVLVANEMMVGTVVSDEACLVRYHGTDGGTWPVADAHLTLIPAEPPDYDAEILAAVEEYGATGYKPCVFCSHPLCRIFRAVKAKRLAQDAGPRTEPA